MSSSARSRTSGWVSQTRPGAAPISGGRPGALRRTGGEYRGAVPPAIAAVTATPATRNGRPSSVIRSPACKPSASAKAASTTTSPSFTQRPSVSSGWSIDAAVASRPSAWTGKVAPFVASSALITGYGPLWPTTPGSSISASRLARSLGPPSTGGGETAATTSGPAVASRVVW